MGLLFEALSPKPSQSFRVLRRFRPERVHKGGRVCRRSFVMFMCLVCNIGFLVFSLSIRS